MDTPNNKKWLIVLIYTYFIFISLSWVRQVWDFVGNKNSSFLLIGLYVGSASAVCVYYKKVLPVMLFVTAIIAIYNVSPYPRERIHLLEYSILGWLSYWAGGWKAIPYVVLVSILDEIVQGQIPGRVFDFRDIYFNLISSGIGILLGNYERERSSH
jgi:hypothetical protein